jgi:imidazolonepropionase-like amidohydrolase
LSFIFADAGRGDKEKSHFAPRNTVQKKACVTVVDGPAKVLVVVAAVQLLRAECAQQITRLAAAPFLFVRHWLTFHGSLVGFVLFVLAAAAQAEPASLALTHVTVIDPASAVSQPDCTVLIAGDRIAGISQSAPPTGVRVIDGRGKYLIPGLCDMHVHLAGVTADPKWSKATLLPLLIANGVTTVRDMGGDLVALQGWRKEIEAGELIGPRIYCPGPMLDGGKSDPPALLAISAPAEGRAAVRDLKAKGADFIKVLSRLDRESYFAIADESKKQGMTFVGHVPNVLQAREVSDAGQKSIEHIFYSNLTFDCSAREDELRRQSADARAKRDSAGGAKARDEANASFSKEKADALWQTFVRNKTWVVPTLVAMRAIARQREEARSAPVQLAYLPPALRRSWSPDEIEKEVSPEVAQWYVAQFQNDLKIARSMHAAGVQMMAGSDSLDPFNFPGPSLHEELKLLTEVGFTPRQALQAATSKPAEFLNATGEGGWGTIQAGKAADLVLVDADPLTDIGNTRKIAAVIIGGKFLARDDLDQMLAKARTAAGQVK